LRQRFYTTKTLCGHRKGGVVNHMISPQVIEGAPQIAIADAALLQLTA
jgi:hypothetical protein